MNTKSKKCPVCSLINPESSTVCDCGHNFGEEQYENIVTKAYNPLLSKISAIQKRELAEFFKTILDASERSLRGILFMTPEELHLRKAPTVEETDFWLRKVSLALLAYSSYCFSVENQTSPGQLSINMFWQKALNSYNQIFDDNITNDDMNHYAAGLRQDHKAWGSQNAAANSWQLMIRDYTTIGMELLQGIWHEETDQEALSSLQAYTLCKPTDGEKDFNPTARKVLCLGARIWQAHQQIVQPALERLLTTLMKEGRHATIGEKVINWLHSARNTLDIYMLLKSKKY